MNRYWIKIPGPGQFRGEGEWTEADLDNPNERFYFELCQETNYLPTRIQETKPEDDE